MNSKKNKMYGFSIIVTERCNMNCSYCHFFDHVSRKSGKDISDALLVDYLHFIKYFKDNIGDSSVHFRFSGGDPIVLGDRLFEIADKGYEITGLQPYILTAGNGISDEWIDKARASKLSACMISIENPLNPDKGSMNPYLMMEKMKKYDSPDFRLLPGVTVVKNKDFKDIYQISKIIYEELGVLPKIQEINYGSFMSPTDRELDELYKNLYRVFTEFKGKAHFDYFSYISPLYNASHHARDAYLSELNMDNKHEIGVVSNEVAMKRVLSFVDKNYPEHNCEKKQCEWRDECKNVKWLWKINTNKMSADQRISDYCRLKKTINQAYYDAFVS